VYILEAHAKDVWPLGKKICFNQPKTIEERLQVANTFVKDYGFQIPMLVDEIDNNFNDIYAAWPERYNF
jgi:type I thyroxine 5'-deiodinase